MVETYNDTQIEFESVKMDILKKVSGVGPIGEVNSWRLAFPEIEFPDRVYSKIVDEALFENGSGNHEMYDVNWNERTVAEKMFYVAYLTNPASVEVGYDVVIAEELKTTKVIKDPDVIWYMWISRCFSDEALIEEAIRDFVGELSKNVRDIIDDLTLEQIEVNNIRVKVAPFR